MKNTATSTFLLFFSSIFFGYFFVLPNLSKVFADTDSYTYSPGGTCNITVTHEAPHAATVADTVTWTTTVTTDSNCLNEPFTLFFTNNDPTLLNPVDTDGWVSDKVSATLGPNDSRTWTWKGQILGTCPAGVNTVNTSVSHDGTAAHDASVTVQVYGGIGVTLTNNTGSTITAQTRVKNAAGTIVGSVNTFDVLAGQANGPPLTKVICSEGPFRVEYLIVGENIWRSDNVSPPSSNVTNGCTQQFSINYNGPVVTPPPPPPPPPSSPPTLDSFTANNVCPATASLSWTCASTSFCAPLPASDPGCPSGYWVDISQDPNFGTYKNKCVKITSTNAPGGFSGLSLDPGITYHARVYNGLHSNFLSITIPANNYDLCSRSCTLIDPSTNTNSCNHDSTKPTCTFNTEYIFLGQSQPIPPGYQVKFTPDINNPAVFQDWSPATGQVSATYPAGTTTTAKLEAKRNDGFALASCNANVNITNWVGPACNSGVFSGCNQTGQARCTDWGNPSNSTWAICQKACTLSNPNDFCVPFAYDLTCTSMNATPGDTVTSTVTTTLKSGTPQLVSLSVTGLPPGASATFSPASVTPTATSTMTVTTSLSTPGGDYILNVNGSPAGSSLSCNLSIGDCSTDCTKCAKINTCSNTTYDTCDTSPCSAPGATSTTTFTCSASKNAACQGTYQCGIQPNGCVPPPPPGSCTISPEAGSGTVGWLVTTHPPANQQPSSSTVTVNATSQTIGSWTCADIAGNWTCSGRTAQTACGAGILLNASYTGDGTSCSQSYTCIGLQPPSCKYYPPYCYISYGVTICVPGHWGNLYGKFDMEVHTFLEPSFDPNKWPQYCWYTDYEYGRICSN